ncbi:STAS domain-containing protein [Niallia taxi]|nr:STAS domain-containing protein [Niallia taxi]
MGVLPLVGDIDTRRSHELMEKALTSAVDLRLNYIFIDLSGVPIIDTMVANGFSNYQRHAYRIILTKWRKL